MSDVVSPAPAAPSSTPAPAATPKAPAAPSTPSPSAPKTAAPKSDAVGSNLPPGMGGDPKPEKTTAPAKTETPAEAAARRKYKLKVDGAEQELELDDTEVSIRLQKAMAAEKRMQEAAQTRKDFQAFVEAVKQDPFSVLKDPTFGLDLEQLAIERLKREYEESQLSEPERKLKAYEREIAEFKKKEEAAKAEQVKKVQAEREARVHKEIEASFAEALESEALPRNRQTLYMMAEIMRSNLEHGIDLTPKQMAAEVNERLRGINQHVIKQLKGEHLAKYLGDEVVREIVKFSIAKVKPASAAQPFEPPTPVEPALDGDDAPERSTSKQRLMSMKEWRQFTRR